ncbi:MAG: GNAT family N-acetyltransferase [Gaiellaceae bacterium]
MGSRPFACGDGRSHRPRRPDRRALPRRSSGRFQPNRRRAGRSLVYLADVYVHADHRGGGRGVELVRFTVVEGPFAERRWILHTADAQGLYERFGFNRGERLLERPSRD